MTLWRDTGEALAEALAEQRRNDNFRVRAPGAHDLALFTSLHIQTGRP